MSEAVKFAISQGIEIEIAHSCDGVIVSVAYQRGNMAYVYIERLTQDKIMTELDKLVLSLIEKVTSMAGLRQYIISTGYRYN